MQYIPLAYQSGADLPVRPWGPGIRTPAAGKNAAAPGLASFSAQPNATHFACRSWWNFWTIESIIEPGGVKGMKMQKNKIAQNLMIALMKEEFFLGIARLFQTALDTTVTPDETE